MICTVKVKGTLILYRMFRACVCIYICMYIYMEDGKRGAFIYFKSRKRLDGYMVDGCV